VTRALLSDVLAQVPDGWLEGPMPDEPPSAVRTRYVDQLLARLDGRPSWLPPLEAQARAGAAGRRRAPRGENRPAWLGPPPPEGVSQR
jgi:hypothetical protein